MARKSKKRTQAIPKHGATGSAAASSSARTPKSMVIRIGAGEVGSSVTQLVQDVRRMMEPETASRLRERRSNRLRDYTTMAGPLGVSHLLLFSRSSTGNTNLRIALTPQGPTLHFRVEKYSLCKDVLKALRHPKMGGKEHPTPPLLVMNNFSAPPPADGERPSVPRHLEALTTTIFQSLFPPISPQTTPLSSIRRVLVLNRELATSPSSAAEPVDDGSYVLNLRHYAITTRRTGLPRTIRRINAAETMVKRGLPNLGKLRDVADYILDPGAVTEGFTSGSEVETDAEVEVLETAARRVLSRKQLEAQRAREEAGEEAAPGVEKRAVKLVELGPRMKLRMTKVEAGVCAGRVMWHEYLHKSPEEVQEMERVWETRRREKEERKRVQKENVQRKRKEQEQAKKSTVPPKEGGAAVEDEMDEDDWDSDALEVEDEMDADVENKVPAG